MGEWKGVSQKCVGISEQFVGVSEQVKAAKILGVRRGKQTRVGIYLVWIV